MSSEQLSTTNAIDPFDVPDDHGGTQRSDVPHPVDVHVGNKLRLRRRLLGMSQAAVAGQVGISFQQLQKYESGSNRVGASRLYQLAQVLGVAPSAFFQGLAGEDGGQESTVGAIESEGLRVAAGWQAIPDERLRKAIAAVVSASRNAIV